jgi:hypothetical protein
MTDSLKTLIAALIGIMSWIIMLVVFGFVFRINYEIFMFGWGFIK